LAVIAARLSVAMLVIADALGNPLIQPLALLWVKLQPTNQVSDGVGSGCLAYVVADGLDEE
jgi:hypothetical protein